MTIHTIPERRAWLTGAIGNLLSLPFVLHYDVLAYADTAGVIWVMVEARRAGAVLIAASLYRFDPAALVLEPRTMAPALAGVYWGRDNNKYFKALHPLALALCVGLPGYTRVSVLCHYISRGDAEPMPRGTINRYTYTRQRVAAGAGAGDPAPLEFEQLPDLL